MRGPRTEAERAQISESMRRAWADGRFAHRRRGMPPRHWTSEQSHYLTALAGAMPVEEIADALERRFYVRRTPNAIRAQAKQLGVSLWTRGYSLGDLERVFGVDHRTIVRAWVGGGHLQGRRWSGRGEHDGWWFEPADVEQFIRGASWLIDLGRMRRRHPLTRYAETTLRADPWLAGVDEIGRALGLSSRHTRKWLLRGLIPHRRRPAGNHGQIVVRGRDVAAIREAIALAERRTLQRTAPVSRPCAASRPGRRPEEGV